MNPRPPRLFPAALALLLASATEPTAAESRGLAWSAEYNYGDKIVVARLDHLRLYWNETDTVQHNVIEFSTKEDYDACDFTNSIRGYPAEASDRSEFHHMARVGPFAERGMYYIGSSVGGDCMGDGGGGGAQKLAIRAVAKTFAVAGNANQCEEVPDEKDATTSDSAAILTSRAARRAKFFKKCKTACAENDECHGFSFKKGKKAKKGAKKKKNPKTDKEPKGKGKDAETTTTTAAPGSCAEESKTCPNKRDTVSRNPEKNCQFDKCPDDKKACADGTVCKAQVKYCADGTFVNPDPCDGCAYVCQDGSTPTNTRQGGGGGDCNKGCTKDLGICSDGSKIVRDPCNDCEFGACPEGTTCTRCGGGTRHLRDGAAPFSSPVAFRDGLLDAEQADDLHRDDHQDEDGFFDDEGDNDGRDLKVMNAFKEPPVCTLLGVVPTARGGKKDRDFKCIRINSRLWEVDEGGYVYDVSSGIAAPSS